MPNLNIIITGAENGKILNTIQTGLPGNNISRLKNQNGATENIVKILASPWASRTVPLTAAIHEHSTANNR